MNYLLELINQTNVLRQIMRPIDVLICKPIGMVHLLIAAYVKFISYTVSVDVGLPDIVKSVQKFLSLEPIRNTRPTIAAQCGSEYETRWDVISCHYWCN